VAVAAGDLIIVGAYSNGTHAANGMSVKDSVNNVNYTTILEVDNGGASSRWFQCFVYKTPNPMSSSDTFTFTPYALSAANGFAVDIFRGVTASQEAVASSLSGSSAASAAIPALNRAPVKNSLVVSFLNVGSASTGLSAGATFTLGSTDTINPTLAIGYVLNADGASSYAQTWTWTTAGTNAGLTAAFTSNAINMNNYLAGKAGDGASSSEKIR
jgi:hypothetical protein